MLLDIITFVQVFQKDRKKSEEGRVISIREKEERVVSKLEYKFPFLGSQNRNITSYIFLKGYWETSTL